MSTIEIKRVILNNQLDESTKSVFSTLSNLISAEDFGLLSLNNFSYYTPKDRDILRDSLKLSSVQFQQTVHCDLNILNILKSCEREFGISSLVKVKFTNIQFQSTKCTLTIDNPTYDILFNNQNSIEHLILILGFINQPKIKIARNGEISFLGSYSDLFKNSFYNLLKEKFHEWRNVKGNW